MTKSFAQLVSTIINPIALISIIPYVLVYRVTQNPQTSFYWLRFSFIFILIFSMFVLIGIRTGYFSNLDISERKQRPLLYSFSIMLSLIYMLFLFLFHAPFVLFAGTVALALGLAIAEFINTKIKISLHAGTLTAFVTTIVIIYGIQFAPLYALVPLVAWARIKTRNHTPIELMLGTIVGFLLTLVVYFVFDYIM